MNPAIEQRLREQLTPQLIEDFRRDGAVCVRQLLSSDEVALLREGIDANLAAPSPRAKVASRPGDPGFFIEDFCNWQDNEAYRRVIFDSALPAAAGLLTGSQTIRLYHDHMLTKEPGTRAPTPWHQDQPYYNVEGEQNVSMWIAVDPVRRHSTLEFVAGSHRGPWLMPRSFMDQPGEVVPRRQPGRPARHRRARATGTASSAGRSNPATWSASTCWRCMPRPASTATDGGACSRCASSATTCAMRRAPGSHRPSSRAWPNVCRPVRPMDDPLFPVLWTAA